MPKRNWLIIALSVATLVGILLSVVRLFEGDIPRATLDMCLAILAQLFIISEKANEKDRM